MSAETNTPMAGTPPHGVDLPATLARMKAAAEQATPGPWVTSRNSWGSPQDVHPQHRDYMLPIALTGGDKTCGFYGHNATYIATCDPTTILALIAEVEAVMGENERLKGEYPYRAPEARASGLSRLDGASRQGEDQGEGVRAGSRRRPEVSPRMPEHREVRWGDDDWPEDGFCMDCGCEIPNDHNQCAPCEENSMRYFFPEYYTPWAALKRRLAAWWKGGPE